MCAPPLPTNAESHAPSGQAVGGARPRAAVDSRVGRRRRRGRRQKKLRSYDVRSGARARGRRSIGDRVVTAPDGGGVPKLLLLQCRGSEQVENTTAVCSSRADERQSPKILAEWKCCQRRRPVSAPPAACRGVVARASPAMPDSSGVGAGVQLVFGCSAGHRLRRDAPPLWEISAGIPSATSSTSRAQVLQAGCTGHTVALLMKRVRVRVRYPYLNT